MTNEKRIIEIAIADADENYTHWTHRYNEADPNDEAFLDYVCIELTAATMRRNALRELLKRRAVELVG